MRSALGLLVAILTAAYAHVSCAQAPSAPDEKVKLASQFLVMSHHGDIVREAWTRQFKLFWSFCEDGACRADLDGAIDRAFSNQIGVYERAYANLLADRLSESDLRAAISFVESPGGQSLSRAQLEMSDGIGALGHEISMSVYVEVSKEFCPKHQDICRGTGSGIGQGERQ